MFAAVVEIVINVLAHSWLVLVEAAPWLILGFAAAGLVQAFVSTEAVGAHLGGKGFGPVVRAALWGIPLPLCSCGVLPAAMGLRKQGATKGATVSFLISTPETGVDSIAVTYALMDPLMTVWRPLSALVTAVVAGVVETVVSARDEVAPASGSKVGCACDSSSAVDCASDSKVGCASGTKAGCASDFKIGTASDLKAGCGEKISSGKSKESLGARLVAGLKYGFVELLWEIAPWLAVGIVAAGAISALVPQGWLEAGLGGGFVAMLVMLVAGVPMYICATASTPVAAALILKGLSPGAALVFLLVGPATNVATLIAVGKSLGLGASLRYLASIALSALAMGVALDWVYSSLEMTATVAALTANAEETALLGTVSAVLLVGALLYAYLSQRRRPGFT
jgi:hypothetical protein